LRLTTNHLESGCSTSSFPNRNAFSAELESTYRSGRISRSIHERDRAYQAPDAEAAVKIEAKDYRSYMIKFDELTQDSVL